MRRKASLRSSHYANDFNDYPFFKFTVVPVLDVYIRLRNLKS